MGSAAGEIVIELGEVLGSDVDELPRDRSARWARPWLAALCAVGLIWGVDASAAPPPPSAWETPFVLTEGVIQAEGGAGMAIAGDLLLVLGPDRHTIGAWNLRTGELLWSVASDFNGLGNAELVAGVLVVSGVSKNPPSVDGDGDGDGLMPHSYGLDPATGARRWERPGSAFAQVGSGPLLFLMAGGDQGFELAAVDPVTGADQWRTGESDGANISISNETWEAMRTGGTVEEALVSDWRHGALSSLSISTGTLTPLGTLPPRASIMDFDDQVIIAEITRDEDNDPSDGYDESVIALFDRVDLHEVWRTPDRQLLGGTYLNRCGSLICESTEQSTTARDARTGRPVWTASVQPYAVWRRGGGDLLIAQRSQDNRDMALIDPADGSERLDLGKWRVLGRHDGALLVGLPAGPGERMWFGVVPAAGALSVRPLARFGPANADLDSCSIIESALTCRLLHEVIVVDLAEALRPGPR